MPIYEYICERCDEKQEIIQKFNEDVPKTCPKCHAEGTLKKSVTTSAFHLKGGGWYKDLYSSSKKSDQEKKDTVKSSSKENTADTKSGETSKPKKTED